MKNFPNKNKKRGNQIQEAHGTLRRHYQKRSSPQYIIVQLYAVKHKAKIKMCMGKKDRLPAENLQIYT